MEHLHDQVGVAQAGIGSQKECRPVSDAEQKSKAAYAEADAKTRQAYREEADLDRAKRTAKPIMDRLNSDIENLGEQIERSLRARNILERHPEFSEFIELLGLIRVPLRVTPVQSGRALVTE